MEFNPALIFIIIFVVLPIIERLLKAGKQQQPPDDPRRLPQQQRPRPATRPEGQGARTSGEGQASEMLPDDLWELLTGERRQPPTVERPPEPAARELPPAEVAPRELPPWAQPPAPPQPRERPRVFYPEQDAERARTPERGPGARGRRPKQARTRDERERRPDPGERRRLPSVEKRRLPPVEMRGSRLPEEAPRARRHAPPPDDYVRELPVQEAPRVVSLEELQIDDEARHERFHERLAASDVPVVSRRPENPLARLFRDDDELRRAIIMNEVLGRPRGLD